MTSVLIIFFRHLAKILTLSCALLCLLFSSNLFAQSVTNNQSAPTQNNKPALLTMNMRDADIRALIQWVADNTGKNLVVHKDVQGQVTVLSSSPVTSDEAYQIFLSVLQMQGFAAIDTGNVVKIVPAAIAQQSGIPFSGTNGVISGDMVVQIFRPQNLAVNELVELLKPMASREAVISPFPTGNMLVIADHANNIANLRNLVSNMDQKGGSEMELIHLDYANAKDALNSLKLLLAGSGENNIPLNLSADERSNSLLLAGDPAQRKRIRQLVKQIDMPVAGEGSTKVYYLHYVSAEELVPILKSVAKSIERDQKQENSGISIDASKTSNALIVNAPPAMQSSVQEVIAKLDIRRAQVLVEAIIVEVSDDAANDLGVKWNTINIGDTNGSQTFGAVDTLGNLAAGSLNEKGTEFIAGRGFSLGYFNDGNLQAVLRALEKSNKANILSTPNIVALDNQEASLLVGQNVPFITGQATSASSPTDNPFTTVERQDIGISLIVTPRINQGDSITLAIKQKIENIAPALTTKAADLITNKREILTSALIKDNQTLVLGGLIDDQEVETTEKVPVLGSLPFIGKLFSSKSTTRVKKNLMVFIHPTILKDDAQIAELTQNRYKFMQARQAEFGQDAQAIKQVSPELKEFSNFSPKTQQ